MTDSVSAATLRAKILGQARTGTVAVRDFDEGVVETLGATIIEGPQFNGYFITELSGLDAPPGLPGIPVVFSHPEEVFQTHRIPVIEVRRDDISPALSRYHPGMGTYRVAKTGAIPRTVMTSVGLRSGFTGYEEAYQAAPFDILYTINIMARQRAYMAAANRILAYVMKIYQPYSAVFVRDSEGDTRSYEAFLERISPLDNVPEVAERHIGFALSLRVEAELDINDPMVFTSVSRPPVIRTHLK